MAGRIDSLKQKAIWCNDEPDSDHEEDRGDLIGISLEKLNLGPRKKLVIFSLGGFLCHRVLRKGRNPTIPKHRSPDAAYGSFLVYKRPFCDEFVKFCFERFEMGIWSSAKEWYLDNALDCVMGKFKSNMLFAWDQDKCTNSGFNTLENKHKPIFLKEFEKLYSNLSRCRGPKGELRGYLAGLAEASDVPSYVKKHPFGQPPITTAHPDWDYYSKIIHLHGKK